MKHKLVKALGWFSLAFMFSSLTVFGLYWMLAAEGPAGLVCWQEQILWFRYFEWISMLAGMILAPIVFYAYLQWIFFD